MSATILNFPVQAVCDSCHCATAEDDLSTFACCDARVCRRRHGCDCDRRVAHPLRLCRMQGWGFRFNSITTQTGAIRHDR